MKQILIRSLLALIVFGLLAGCAKLHDEDYYWCKDVECPEPVAAYEPVDPEEPAGPPEPPPVPKSEVTVDLSKFTVTLLFPFDAADFYIHPEVLKRLNEVIQKLEAEEIKVDHILITGHTDRIGTDAYNQSLSIQRAKEVQEYLEAQGVEIPMEIRGVGSEKPVITNCPDDMPRDELIECLQPNRRVTIKLIPEDDN